MVGGGNLEHQTRLLSRTSAYRSTELESVMTLIVEHPKKLLVGDGCQKNCTRKIFQRGGQVPVLLQEVLTLRNQYLETEVSSYLLSCLTCFEYMLSFKRKI